MHALHGPHDLNSEGCSVPETAQVPCVNVLVHIKFGSHSLCHYIMIQEPTGHDNE